VHAKDIIINCVLIDACIVRECVHGVLIDVI
jgi:hypothetical protein